MAYTTINKSTDNFNTVTYTGNGSTNNITGVGFQPDWLWIKNRDATENNVLYDAIRGVTKQLYSNTTGAESTNATALTAFASDGFNLATTNSNTNSNGANFVSWNWKAGGGQGSSNTDGSTNTTYTSANTTAGFSIVSWTGTGSATTLGHGLGATPQVILVKNRSEVYGWQMYHPGLGGNNKYIAINSSDAVATDTSSWNNTAPTSSVFSVGASDANNKSTNNIIAYCFAEKTGYSKFGSYTGNGSTDGPMIFTGFKPAWVLGKRTDSANNWYLFDTVRDPFNLTQRKLRSDTTAAENNNSSKAIDILSNGFKIRNSDAEFNASGGTYIYMAFGQSLVGSNNVPCTAR